MIEEVPIRFVPYLKTVIWGGNKICAYKGIEQKEPNIGESWEISAVPGYESIVAEGSYKGKSILEMIDMFGEELLGKDVYKKYNGKFPLLIKLIDANDNLSVQVHPDDNLAKKRHNSLGKTEMWYIIDSDEGAKIYAGLNKELTAEEYERKVAENSLTEVLAVHDSKPGDIFFLPAGRVHAIGAGNLLAEIQESSDVTYRIYDYGRKDKEGNTRELHTELAKDAIDFKVYSEYKNPPVSDDNDDCEIVKCDHFTTRRVLIKGEKNLQFDNSSFTVIIGIEGEAELMHKNGVTSIKPGETYLLPAVMKDVKLKGNATLLISRA